MASPKVVHGLFLCLLAVGAVHADDVFAQAPDAAALDEGEREELGRLFRVAQAAYESENYLEAIAALKSAYTMFPEPNILYRIGDAYEKMGDLTHAAEHYRAYVAAAPDAQDAGLVGRRVADLERRAAALERDVAPAVQRTGLVFDTQPAGASVRLNETALAGETPMRIELEPGTHTVIAALPGYERHQQEVTVEAGETLSLVVQLRPVVAAPGRSPLPWVIAAAGGVATVAGGGLLVGALVANNKIRAWDEHRNEQHASGGPVDPRPANYDATQRRRAMFSTTGAVVGGVGVALVATGVVWAVSRGESKNALRATPNGVALSF